MAQNGTTLGGFAAIPVGKTASTSLDDEGGFVKVGWGLVFDSKLRAKSWPVFFSLNFHSTYQWNRLDNNAIAKAFTEKLGMRTEVGESRHSPIVMTIGPKLDLPVSDILSVGVTGGIGIMFNNTKSFRIQVFDSQNNTVFSDVLKFDNNPAFTYVLGVDLRFRLVEDLLDLQLYADFNAANQNLEYEFGSTEPYKSVEELRFLNTGLKLTFYALE